MQGVVGIWGASGLWEDDATFDFPVYHDRDWARAELNIHSNRAPRMSSALLHASGDP